PFSTKIQAEMGEGVEYNLDVCIDQLTAAMTGSREIEIKGSVMVDAIIFDQYSENVVTDCDLTDYEEEEYLKMPCMVGYISNGEDTLWDIAKRYHTTTESIRRGNPALNDRVDDNTKIKRGEKLLLMKAAR
ncbi:MAG: LysM peptidoglycan-binding domain-containing protein, partial [Lachnospira sp.]|nr:LysM peptidoglycan-binding domain-containing protein [Lachnospira sp.]